MAFFKDIDDFAELAPVLNTADWKMIRPSVELVERQFLRDQLLGPALFDEYMGQYQASIADTDPIALTDAVKAIVDLVRPAIAGLSMERIQKKLSVLTTSQGSQEISGPNQHAPSMWRARDAQKALMEEGLGYLDQLIDHLMRNNPAHWGESAYQQLITQCIVRSAQDVDPFNLGIGTSAWLMHKLRPAIIRAQQEVRETLSPAAWEQVMAYSFPNADTNPFGPLISLIRSVVTHRAMAEQISLRSINFDSDGAWSWSGATSGGQTSGGAVQAADKRLTAWVNQYNAIADSDLKAMERTARELATIGSFNAYRDSLVIKEPFVRGTTTPEDSSTFSSL